MLDFKKLEKTAERYKNMVDTITSELHYVAKRFDEANVAHEIEVIIGEENDEILYLSWTRNGYVPTDKNRLLIGPRDSQKDIYFSPMDHRLLAAIHVERLVDELCYITDEMFKKKYPG